MSRLIKRLGRSVSRLKAIYDHPLHRGRRIAAVISWLRLALSNHLTPTRQIAIPYVGGAVLNWPVASSSVSICAKYGLGEYADMAFCLHLLRPEDFFCDVGANAGVYTILAAHAVGCQVVAAEPVPQAFNLLMQNIYANGVAEKVEAHRVGIGGEDGSLRFTASLWSYNHVLEHCEEEGFDSSVVVRVCPLDAVLADRVPFALKIDVEGFEAQVIAGATKTLFAPDLQAIIIEIWAGHLARYGDEPQNLLETIAAAGFHGPYWYDPAARKLIEPGRQEKMKFNQIFVRDKALVERRLATSKQYKVHGTLV